MEQATTVESKSACKHCGGTHPTPATLSDDDLRKLAEQMIAGKVAWSPVCQPSMALAHGVLRLLERLDRAENTRLATGSTAPDLARRARPRDAHPMSWLGRWKNPGAPVDTHATRAIGTTYTPSATAFVLHFVTLQLVCTTGQTATVQLLSDSASPPTTERTKASHNIIGTVIVQLVWLTAPGDNIKLVASGAGTVTIVDLWEVPLGAPTE